MLKTFSKRGIDIAYWDEGEGRPILLIHGFGSNHRVNWLNTGWVELLKRKDRRVIALDNRGHGASTKLYDPADYASRLMAEDAAGLIEHLNLGPTPVMGYSMGARIAAFLALQRPDLVSALILGGLGIHLVEGAGLPPTLAEAMEAKSLDDIIDPMGRMFRSFAEQTGADRKALAACIRGSRQSLTKDEVGRIAQPVLIAVGTRDTIAGAASSLAALMPSAEVLDIPGRDHNPAVGDKVFKAGVLDFLSKHGV